MSRDVKKYVKTCKNCQEGKSYHRYKALLKPLAIPNRFGQTLHIDHVGPIKPGPNGEKYIFTVIDSFSQWPWTFAVHNTSADVAANCLLKVVSEAGAFKHLISDNAASFTGKVMTQFCKLFDIKKIHVASYHSASNGKIERFHSSLENSLKASVTNDRDWVEMLPFIELAFRSSPIVGMGLSLYELRHNGYSMGLPIDMMMLKKCDEEHHSSPEYIVKMRNNIDWLNYITLQNKGENQLVMKETYDRNVTPYHFFEGQRCYLFDPVAKANEYFKLRRKWRGEFIIHKLSSHKAFLYNPKTNKYIEKSVQINRIKPCYQRDDIPTDDEDIEDIPLVEVTYPLTFPKTITSPNSHPKNREQDMHLPNTNASQETDKPPTSLDIDRHRRP